MSRVNSSLGGGGRESFAVRCSGPEAAPGVLLVHGWGSAARTFDALAARLAQSYRVVVPDLRGHGATPAGSDPRRWPVSAMVDDLAALVRSAPRPLVALGHSLGGQMVSTLAVRHDGLVAGVAVLDPAYGAGRDEVAAVPARAAAIRAGGCPAAFAQVEPGFSAVMPPAARDDVRADMLAASPEVLLALLETTYTGPEERGSLDAVRSLAPLRRVPVLAVYSTPRAAAVERTLPHGGPVEVRDAPGPGHYVHLEHPDWTAEALLDWLAGVL
jgi:pimeloyl-ACP methyl ester carboxylesterase